MCILIHILQSKQILTPPYYTNLQNSMISFDYSWFLAKNISNFVSLPCKLHNRYCHIVRKTYWKHTYWILMLLFHSYFLFFQIKGIKTPGSCKRHSFIILVLNICISFLLCISVQLDWFCIPEINHTNLPVCKPQQYL